jgi:hypothetical protein
VTRRAATAAIAGVSAIGSNLFCKMAVEVPSAAARGLRHSYYNILYIFIYENCYTGRYFFSLWGATIPPLPPPPGPWPPARCLRQLLARPTSAWPLDAFHSGAVRSPPAPQQTRAQPPPPAPPPPRRRLTRPRPPDHLDRERGRARTRLLVHLLHGRPRPWDAGAQKPFLGPQIMGKNYSRYDFATRNISGAPNKILPWCPDRERRSPPRSSPPSVSSTGSTRCAAVDPRATARPRRAVGSLLAQQRAAACREPGHRQDLM